MERGSEKHKIWLFDLAHENNMCDNDILKGLIKYYFSEQLTYKNVLDEIVFHTNYGVDGVECAQKKINQTMQNIIQDNLTVVEKENILEV